MIVELRSTQDMRINDSAGIGSFFACSCSAHSFNVINKYYENVRRNENVNTTRKFASCSQARANRIHAARSIRCSYYKKVAVEPIHTGICYTVRDTVDWQQAARSDYL